MTRAQPAKWTWLSRSPKETERLGHRIGESLQGGEVLALYGELGTGKTSLVRGIAAGIGAPSRVVTSPTFVLIHEYRGRLPLAHADLYRVESPDELHQIGLSDYFNGETVVTIEWAEKATAELPSDRLEIRLTHGGARQRDLELEAFGGMARALLRRIRSRMGGRPQPRVQDRR
jgi:tRNA threonylcarbamoyladenosine biosynthesis protein TsaE